MGKKSERNWQKFRLKSHRVTGKSTGIITASNILHKRSNKRMRGKQSQKRMAKAWLDPLWSSRPNTVTDQKLVLSKIHIQDWRYTHSQVEVYQSIHWRQPSSVCGWTCRPGGQHLAFQTWDRDPKYLKSDYFPEARESAPAWSAGLE